MCTLHNYITFQVFTKILLSGHRKIWVLLKNIRYISTKKTLPKTGTKLADKQYLFLYNLQRTLTRLNNGFKFVIESF